MKVEKTTVEKLQVDGVDNLDSLTMYIECYGGSAAKVTMECYGSSWSAYWGSMGGSVKEFFLRCNTPYLVNCFSRGISCYTDNIDRDSWYEGFIPRIKKRVIEWRRDTSIDAETAREWYDHDWVENGYEDMFPVHDYDFFKEPFTLDVKDLFIDEEDWDTFCRDTEIEYERNTDYDYLCRIVDTARKALVEVEAIPNEQ